MTQAKTCATEDCNNTIRARGTRCSKCVYNKNYHGAFTYKRQSREDVFWENIEKTDSCWIWKAGKNPDGYGMMFYHGKYKGAHRISWSIHHGDIPDGLCVLHRCDVRNCVNPEHLFLGNHKKNMEDMCRKGRHALGNRKLTDSNVIEIKKLIELGNQNLTIARKFNMDPSTISNIRYGKHWSNLI